MGHAATTGKFSLKKNNIVQKLDHLTCSKFVMTTSVYKPLKLVIQLGNIYSISIQVSVYYASLGRKREGSFNVQAYCVNIYTMYKRFTFQAWFSNIGHIEVNHG